MINVVFKNPDICLLSSVEFLCLAYWNDAVCQSNLRFRSVIVVTF